MGALGGNRLNTIGSDSAEQLVLPKMFVELGIGKLRVHPEGLQSMRDEMRRHLQTGTGIGAFVGFAIGGAIRFMEEESAPDVNTVLSAVIPEAIAKAHPVAFAQFQKLKSVLQELHEMDIDPPLSTVNHLTLEDMQILRNCRAEVQRIFATTEHVLQNPYAKEVLRALQTEEAFVDGV